MNCEKVYLSQFSNIDLKSEFIPIDVESKNMNIAQYVIKLVKMDQNP